jgi:hypothetical protein
MLPFFHNMFSCCLCDFFCLFFTNK